MPTISQLPTAASVDGTDVLALVDMPGQTSKQATVAQVKDYLVETGSFSTAGTCSLEQFGAVGDGVTSDQTAFTAAISALGAGTYKAIVLGSGKTYLVTGAHTVPAGCAIIGQGSSSVIKTATNAGVLVVGGEDVSLLSFRILGSGSGSSQVGVKVGNSASAGSGFARLRISGVAFDSLGSHGSEYNQNPLSGAYAGPRYTDCLAKNCGGSGFHFGTRGEYASLVNCASENNAIGVYVGAGNITWTGGNITRNATNVQLATGDNDAHGIFCGTNINHPSGANNVLVGAITQGHSFVGCHIYEGAISATNASGVRFVGCFVDVGSYVANGSILEFDACTFMSSYSPAISESNGGVCRFPGARSLTSAVPSFIGRRQTSGFPSGSEAFFGTPANYAAGNQADALRCYVKTGGYGFLGTGSTAVAYWEDSVFNFMQKIFLTNVSAPGTPAGGGYLYVESGALKYKGSGGTVTTLGNA